MNDFNPSLTRPRQTSVIGQTEFIALIACIMFSTALAIDIMLPAFGAVRSAFRLPSDSTLTARIVTFFFLGQLGQLVFGPLSDGLGRIPVLRLGFVLYIVGGIGAALSSSLEMLFVARFVVGLGCAAMTVSATATVRDRLVGDQMARTTLLSQTIFLIVPIVAPFIGAAVLAYSTWQVVFVLPAFISLFVFVWSFRLNESLPPERRTALRLRNMAQAARLVCGNRDFIRYTAIAAILFVAFSSFIGSSERIVGEIFQQPAAFKWIFGATGLMMAIITFWNAHLVERFGARRMVRILVSIYSLLAVGLCALTFATAAVPNLYAFFIIIALLQSVGVVIFPNTSALALEPLGEAAGMGAAINSTVFFVAGSLLGSLVDRLLVGNVGPLAVSYLVGGLLALGLVVFKRSRASKDPSHN